MVKHIVLFKLKDVDTQQKMEVMKAFKTAIEALPKEIDYIRNIEVGINTNPDEEWNIALYSEFDTLEDVRRYAVHPSHKAAAALLAELKEARSCVDYEV